MGRDLCVTPGFVTQVPISAGSSLFELLSLWGPSATRPPSIFVHLFLIKTNAGKRKAVPTHGLTADSDRLAPRCFRATLSRPPEIVVNRTREFYFEKL
jgi:hypothetical protein